MRDFRKVKDFNGYSFILSEEEFNCWVNTLNIALDVYNGEEHMAYYLRKWKEVKDLIFTYGRFDKENREVHCRLGDRDIFIVIHLLTLMMPQSDNCDAFNERIALPETKEWVER